MKHTTIRHMLAIAVLVACPVVYGQSSGSGILNDEQFAKTRALLQAERAKIIREELRLSEGESAAFWPIYEEYRSDIRAVRDRQAELFGRFLKAREAGGIDDAFARGLLEDHFDIRSDILKIQKRYLRKYRKVLPEVKVARFYQLENMMDAKGDAELAFFVPPVE